MGGSISAFFYLKTNREDSIASYHGDKTYFEINQSLSSKDLEFIVSSLAEKIDSENFVSPKMASLELDAEERKELIETVKKNITGQLAEDFFLSAKAELRRDLAHEKPFLELREELQNTKRRIREEIEALTRRGNLNLIIGGATTLIAVLLLGYVVLSAQTSVTDPNEFWWHFIPRVTISIFIQVFSFFFLRLYRNSLEDIKYFQNELTNVDSRYAALETSLLFGDKDLIAKAIDELFKTERNSKLQKGESTVYLEQLKQENQSLNDMLSSAKGIISSLKK
jgi:hypothetical protein